MYIKKKTNKNNLSPAWKSKVFQMSMSWEKIKNKVFGFFKRISLDPINSYV